MMAEQSMPFCFPPLVLKEWSLASCEGKSHNIRAKYAEAEFLILNKLRSGVHPEILEMCIRAELTPPVLSYYRQGYLHYALRILKNLSDNGLFAELPTLAEYRELVENDQTHNVIVKYEVMMSLGFSDFQDLHQKCLDGAMELILARHSELDSTAKQLIKGMQIEEDKKMDTMNTANFDKFRSLSAAQREYFQSTKENWGKSTISLASFPPAYDIPVRSTLLSHARERCKTPPPRAMKPAAPPETPLVASRNLSSENGKLVYNVLNSADDVFDEPAFLKNPLLRLSGRGLSFLPQGSGLKSFLETWGYGPPPLLPLKRDNGIPPRTPSPSEYGKPFC